jgi:hypothetical protein
MVVYFYLRPQCLWFLLERLSLALREAHHECSLPYGVRHGNVVLGTRLLNVVFGSPVRSGLLAVFKKTGTETGLLFLENL